MNDIERENFLRTMMENYKKLVDKEIAKKIKAPNISLYIVAEMICLVILAAGIGFRIADFILGYPFMIIGILGIISILSLYIHKWVKFRQSLWFINTGNFKISQFENELKELKMPKKVCYSPKLEAWDETVIWDKA